MKMMMDNWSMDGCVLVNVVFVISAFVVFPN